MELTVLSAGHFGRWFQNLETHFIDTTNKICGTDEGGKKTRNNPEYLQWGKKISLNCSLSIHVAELTYRLYVRCALHISKGVQRANVLCWYYALFLQGAF